jgi:hypothetical protein
LIFLWVVDQIFIVAHVNALLLMWHMCRVSESVCDVRDKNFTFRLFLNFFNFFIFLWIVEHRIIVADVNALQWCVSCIGSVPFCNLFLMRESEFNVVFYILRFIRFI